MLLIYAEYLHFCELDVLCMYYLGCFWESADRCFHFLSETEQGVAQAIIRSVIDFKRDPWPKVSDNAKDLVKRMLDPDPKRRLTAQEVLGKWRFSSILGNHYYFMLDYGMLVSYFRNLS